MVESRMRRSLLGTLSLLGGLAALVLTRFNPTGIAAVQMGPVKLGLAATVALAALFIGLIAFIVAATSPKTATDVPIAAVIVCGAAVFLALKPGVLSRTSSPEPAKAAPANAAPSATVQQSADVPASSSDEQSRRPRTIFDSDFPSSTPPVPSKKVIPTPDSEVSAPTPAPLTATPTGTDIGAKIAAAQARLDAARSAAMAKLESSPDYQAAKAQSDAADAALKNSRLTNEPASPELIAASQAAMNARSKLHKLVADAVARNPAIRQASLELQSLQSSK